MITIQLCGRAILVDDEDVALVRAQRWQFRPKGRTVYVAHSGRCCDGRQRLLHNMIMGTVGIDHRNGNGCDNRRSNLRAATDSQNAANRRKPRGGTSRYKGVAWIRRANRWQGHSRTTWL